MTTTTTTITSVKKEPIKDQIYHIIKRRILNHQYEPGKRLSIMSISREMNVSNSPVREAISMLERDGLVETYPNAGPSVITISEERLAQVAEAILSMLLGALAGSWLLFALCRKLQQLPLINRTGQYSLIIMGTHMPVLEIAHRAVQSGLRVLCIAVLIQIPVTLITGIILPFLRPKGN